MKEYFRTENSFGYRDGLPEQTNEEPMIPSVFLANSKGGDNSTFGEIESSVANELLLYSQQWDGNASYNLISVDPNNTFVYTFTDPTGRCFTYRAAWHLELGQVKINLAFQHLIN